MLKVQNYIPKNREVYQAIKYDGTMKCAKEISLVLGINIEVSVYPNGSTLSFEFNAIEFEVKENQYLVVTPDNQVNVFDFQEFKRTFDVDVKKPYTEYKEQRDYECPEIDDYEDEDSDIDDEDEEEAEWVPPLDAPNKPNAKKQYAKKSYN
jgi:hypothetical protein